MNSHKNFRQKFSNFMQDRYGSDDLVRAVTIVVIALLIVSLICMAAGASLASDIISVVALVLILWCFFRMLSKKDDARTKENERWLRLSKKTRSFAKYVSDWKKYHKQYRVFHCPKCGEVLKVPKGKGKLRITCPKCHETFEKKS